MSDERKQVSSVSDAIGKLTNGKYFEIVNYDDYHMIAAYGDLSRLDLVVKNEKNKVALICPSMMDGGTLYFHVLEHNYFKPLTNRNFEFHFMFCLHRDMVFVIAAFPLEDFDAAKIVAEQTKMNLGKTPTLIIVDGEIIEFPVSGDNVYWLENADPEDLHTKASEHAVEKLASGKYTLDQAIDEVTDAQRVAYKKELDQVRDFLRTKGVKP